MARSAKNRGKSTRKVGTVKQRLLNHGVDCSRERPEDTAEFDQRVRRGLEGENAKAFGGIAARGAITSRVTGDALGRRDERRRQR